MNKVGVEWAVDFNFCFEKGNESYIKGEVLWFRVVYRHLGEFTVLVSGGFIECGVSMVSYYFSECTDFKCG